MRQTWAVKNDFGLDNRGCFERIFAIGDQLVDAAPNSHVA
jgi:hypothetical protein